MVYEDYRRKVGELGDTKMRVSDTQQILEALRVAHISYDHEIGTRPNTCIVCAAVGSVSRHNERDGE